MILTGQGTVSVSYRCYAHLLAEKDQLPAVRLTLVWKMKVTKSPTSPVSFSGVNFRPADPPTMTWGRWGRKVSQHMLRSSLWTTGWRVSPEKEQGLTVWLAADAAEAKRAEARAKDASIVVDKKKVRTSYRSC